MWRQSLFRWLSAVLAMVVFSVECSMHIDLDLTLCGGNKGDWDLIFLIVLRYEMLEDKQCLNVGIFDKLHFMHIVSCILCLFLHYKLLLFEYFYVFMLLWCFRWIGKFWSYFCGFQSKVVFLCDRAIIDAH